MDADALAPGWRRHADRRLAAAGITIALGLAVCVACASSGRRFDEDKVPRIVEGATTVRQIEGWFGPPVSIKRKPSGFMIYRYVYEEASVRDTGMFSRIADFIGSFFGYRRVGSPVNVRYENAVRHELVVLFDPNGVVTTYGYERSENPSQTIY